jgi:uncharacterized cupin superfamily protein
VNSLFGFKLKERKEFNMQIINIKDTEGFSPYDFGKRFSGLDKEVASVFKAQHLGFHLEILNPGCFSCPYHYHEKEEELVIVIEGEAIIRQNDRFLKIKKMDLIFFPTGPEHVHQIYNHTEKPFHYFVLSNRAVDDVCHYPDSHKKLVRNPRSMTQNGIEVDYWKDEEDPSQHWPEYALKGELN